MRRSLRIAWLTLLTFILAALINAQSASAIASSDSWLDAYREPA